ncbi:MAG TPA: phosphohistidine phosphatase SixA [Bacteroidota bacterium]|nr:phosphohistidine phosphatase SixA [Bacteroidota bacterium]
MLIYFLRHGEAMRDSAMSDAQRLLTDKGKKQATAVGALLQRMHTSLDSVFTSPLARARETGTIVQSFVCAHRFNSTEYLTNGANPKQLANLLEEQNVESILLVGHEPHLSETLATFLADNRFIHVEMKPCSLALMEIDSPSHFGTGVLRWLIPVDVIE